MSRSPLFFSWTTLLFLGGALLVSGFFFWDNSPERNFEGKEFVTLVDGSNSYSFSLQQAETVGDFLQENQILLAEKDEVFPAKEEKLTSGSRIFLRRAHHFSLVVDGKEEKRVSLASSASSALEEAGVVLDEDDMVLPSREAVLSENLEVQVIRVEISEEVTEKGLAFKTEVVEDEGLSWRKKVVVQAGEKGVERSLYRVSRHDGKEVNRKLIERTITKEPVTERVTQGTLVEVGKSHTGGASWYAHTGTLSAANPWLPFGSYVRVTNTENGKSVIVKINDRGPFGGGRIIDLDKVAFQEIASLGTGVVNVKMEEIVN